VQGEIVHPKAAKNMVEVTGVRFSYSDPVNPILDIENLIIREGEKVFIYGPSGTGKTTLLEVLSGVLVPQHGTVRIGGIDLTTLSATERDRFRALKMGYVFQNFNLIPFLNVRENIELPLLLGATKVPRYESAESLNMLVKRLGLTELLHRPTNQLSVGQQQRVAVARALIGKPAILFADEPTSSLDYDNRERFLKLMFELATSLGTTLVFVSHDRTLEKLFDRVISFVELNHANHGDHGDQGAHR
jgi:putative ABC transport system ATP-binding protein